MSWEAPTFEEINMSAEIGGYQSEGEDPIRDLPPVASDTARIDADR
ncbi:MAG TPA: hypothetical protein VNO55_16460 [Polyangia bacterium]|nr:hypothetical protein [Polyangia bacterium]